MDRGTVQRIGMDLRATLAAFGVKHGINVTLGAIRFDTTGFRGTLEAAELSGSGEDLRAKADFELAAPVFGLSTADWKREFKYGGATYRVCGIRPRSRRAPIRAENVATGKVFVFPADVVSQLLETPAERAARVADEATEREARLAKANLAAQHENDRAAAERAASPTGETASELAARLALGGGKRVAVRGVKVPRKAAR